MSPGGVDISCNQGAAFRTIQFAVDCASDLDSIFIDAGTYPQTLSIDTSLRLIGAGAGRTVIEASAGDTESVVYLSHLDGTDDTISGVTITRGNSATFGGGVYNDAGYLGRSSLTLIDSLITQNVAAFQGGGIYNEGGAILTLIRTHVTHNTSVGDGGGLYDDGGACVHRFSEVAFNSPNDIVGC